MSEASEGLPPSGVGDSRIFEKTYLGDGLYAQLGRDGMVRITSEDGIRVLEQIFLEPTTIEALLRYLVRIKYISGWARE